MKFPISISINVKFGADTAEPDEPAVVPPKPQNVTMPPALKPVLQSPRTDFRWGTYL